MHSSMLETVLASASGIQPQQDYKSIRLQKTIHLQSPLICAEKPSDLQVKA